MAAEISPACSSLLVTMSLDFYTPLQSQEIAQQQQQDFLKRETE